jgi:hypothetical protein
MVNLLDKIWEIDQELLSHSKATGQSLIRIFRKTLRMFFMLVRDWLAMSKIPENFQFFIRMEENTKGNLSKEFLHSSTEIDKSKLPKLI